MATIGEATSVLQQHWPALSEEHGERDRNEVHAFWGEPPDVETCEAWMPRVLKSYEDAQRELSFAKSGGRVVDDQGRPLSHEAFSAWRQDKVRQIQKRMRRYRWLKEWRHEQLKRAHEFRESTRAEARTMNAQNGQAIKAAIQRYGQLENVYEALETWLAEDTDEAWDLLLEAMIPLRGGRAA